MGRSQMLPVCQDGSGHVQQPWRALQTVASFMGCSVQQPVCVGLLLATCQTARCLSSVVDCAAAGMIFRKEPFFYGHDNYDQLVKIAKVSCSSCPAVVAVSESSFAGSLVCASWQRA